MTLRASLPVCAALLLSTACGETAPPPEFDAPPSPLLYEIADADGQVEGWLFGTMHALPDGVEWRTDAFDAIEAEADMLVVEVIFPENADDGNAIYFRYANSDGQPPLSDRIPTRLQDELTALLDTENIADDYSNTETWAAAIGLARLTSSGDSANGVDRALLASFSDRPQQQLEGLERQFAIFDSLPETEQRDMLAAVVREYRKAKADPARLLRIWRSGDIAALQAEIERGMLADPELRQALLTARNAAWAERLSALLAADPKPLIAVGTAHLVGPDSVAALLEADGYSVRRLQ